MDKKTRSPLVAGLILILLGVFFLIIRLVPDLLDTLSWPFIVIGVVGDFTNRHMSAAVAPVILTTGWRGQNRDYLL
jgi:hypothetical protein